MRENEQLRELLGRVLSHAFPGVIVRDGNREFTSPGLSKRELFAAMAMQGALSCVSREDTDAKQVANFAIECADVLVERLKKDSHE